jgi:hypothetical protein
LGIKVFFCIPTGEGWVTNGFRCEADGCREHFRKPVGRFAKHDRPDFPSGLKDVCPVCGGEAQLWSQGFSSIYRRESGAELNPEGESLPAGAIYAADPEYGYPTGPDGRTLYCVLPDGHTWGIDGSANNCTLPNDKVHRCWVRHGRPEDGTLHVDKNGNTCAAGAGSIKTSKWHGFLHHGELREA